MNLRFIVCGLHVFAERLFVWLLLKKLGYFCCWVLLEFFLTIFVSGSIRKQSYLDMFLGYKLC